MKKLLYMLIMALTVVALYGCTPSTIVNEETEGLPTDMVPIKKSDITNPKTSFKLKEAEKYTIPDGAPQGIHGGPGAIETKPIDYSYYPESKKEGFEKEEGTPILLYRAADGGIIQDFQMVPEADADALIKAMVDNGILGAGTEVKEYSVADSKGKLKLNKVEGVYFKATEDEIVACIVNTFTDNFLLESLELSTDDKDYGVLEYTTKYDAT